MGAALVILATLGSYLSTSLPPVRAIVAGVAGIGAEAEGGEIEDDQRGEGQQQGQEGGFHGGFPSRVDQRGCSPCRIA